MRMRILCGTILATVACAASAFAGKSDNPDAVGHVCKRKASVVALTESDEKPSLSPFSLSLDSAGEAILGNVLNEPNLGSND